MEEKIVIITGANSGIGKAAAIKFALEGYRVIMGCRNLEISRKAQQEIILLSKNNRVDLLQLDVSSFKSIKQFCKEFRNNYEKVDILIHNAAHFKHGEKNYQLSTDGLELTFATNTFGPFLMTELLLDLLAKSDDPRILNACTTNIKHFFDPSRKIDLDNLRGEFKNSRKYNSYKMYGDSKMALLMLTFKMAEEYAKYGVKINAIQIPATKMSKETILKVNSYWRIIAKVQNLFLQETTGMGETYYYICTSEATKNVTGKLFNSNREIMKLASGKMDLVTQAKQLFGTSFYPKYAENPKLIEELLQLYTDLTEIKGA